MQYVYPAVFTWYESEKVYIIKFPDEESWFTEGYSLTEAMENAADVLNVSLWSAEKCGDKIPSASKLEDVKVTDKNSFVQYIFADTEAYAKMLSYEKLLESSDFEKKNAENRSA